MEIKLIESVTLEDYKSILPDIRYSWLEKAYDTVKDLYMFAAIEEGKAVGYSIFLTYKATDVYPLLLYIKVAEDYEGMGIATRMYHTACDVFKKLNYKEMNLTLSAAEDSEDLFIKLGYRFLGDEIYMVYTGATLFDSNVGKNLNQAKPLISKVRSINELSPLQLKSFRQSRAKGKYDLDILKMDTDKLRFFVPDDEICAYIAIRKDIKQNYLLTDMFIKKSPHAKLAIPALFSYFLVSKSLNIKDDSVITLFTNSKNNYEAMLDTFGEPSSAIWSLTYMATL